eukprot:5716490-Pyramimonas_sp.AAC.1
MTSAARVYPPKFCKALAEAIRSSIEEVYPPPTPEQVARARQPEYGQLYAAVSFPAEPEEGQNGEEPGSEEAEEDNQ